MTATQRNRKAARLESRARKLWALRKFLGAVEYTLAAKLWEEARKLREGS